MKRGDDMRGAAQRSAWLALIGSAVVLCSCAPTVPPKPPVEAPPPKAEAAPTEPTSRPLTIAERAAIRDRMAGLEPSPNEPSSPVAGAADYADGFPRLSRAPKIRGDGTLQSLVLLDTGPYLANNNVHELMWTNSTGRPLAIHKVYVWTGVDRGALADVHIEARRASDDSYLAILQWDHYAEPTLPQHGQQFDYASPMVIDPGDKITIKHFAHGFAPGWHAHHLLIIWFK
jgi:hypothetical protein